MREDVERLGFSFGVLNGGVFMIDSHLRFSISTQAQQDTNLINFVHAT
jgi:hypothetical protein